MYLIIVIQQTFKLVGNINLLERIWRIFKYFQFNFGSDFMQPISLLATLHDYDFSKFLSYWLARIAEWIINFPFIRKEENERDFVVWTLHPNCI